MAADATLSLIRIAIEKNDLDKLNELLANSPKDLIDKCDDENGLSLLMIAVSLGHSKVVKELLAKGININLRDHLGNNGLHYACLYKPKNIFSNGAHGIESYIDMIQSLVIQGKLHLQPNTAGETPIFLACKSKNLLAISELLDTDLDVHHRTKEGPTVIEYAISLKDTDIIQEFLHPHRVDLTADILTQLYKSGEREQLYHCIAQKIPLESLNTAGNTILIEAIMKRDKDLIQHLLSNYANKSTPSKDGKLPREHTADEGILSLLTEKPGTTTYLSRSINDFVVHEGLSYPLIRNNKDWVETSESRAPHTSKKTPAEHLVDNDLVTIFTQLYEKTRDNFVTFDLKKKHKIVGIKLFSNASSCAVKDFSIYTSNTGLSGPWQLARTFTAEQKGSETYVDTKGVEQIFKGLYATTRYLKFSIDSNYGQFMTAIHQLVFYGVDCELEPWLASKGYSRYYQPLLKMGYCELAYLWTIQDTEIRRLLRSNPDLFLRFSEDIRELQAAQCALKSLDFEVYPVSSVVEGRKLPEFTVISNPGAMGSVEVKFFGGCEVQGSRVQKLVCDKNGGPSVAVFNDIVVKPAGQYLLEVSSVQNPAIFLAPTEPLVVTFAIKTEDEVKKELSALDDLLDF